ncbi:uncharacterized protein HRG_04585 [Hirsutella rhossiliensis]|uniref:Uncharacterized protein n=1 Tax=Hirsutella rhossiliensis TaxID=111463 RepID=A0A9P8MZH6_9HYPO|nr:uncharacterized protein HRG_04585 [Hirsutella rhossiliensis]KAH0964157.1 hypothetical protein HRG_04585 [Hirsutella rhossiliensis]
MQTRQQSTRQREAKSVMAVPEDRKATRSTRRKAAPDTLVAGLGTSSAPRHPAPRRGAPVGKAFSVTNITVRNGHESQDEEDEDDGGGSESKSSVPRDSAAGGLDSNAEEGEKERQQIMTQLRPDLERAIAELMECLDNRDSGNKILRAVFITKRDAFMYLRKYYQEAKTTSVLIDWTKPGALHNLVQADEKAVIVLARANQVATLDYIRRIQTDSHLDKQAFLQTLDTSFPTLFRTPNLHKQYPWMMVKIRTCYLIETLANHQSKATVQDSMANIFCETTDNLDYASLCETGPYRSLGGEDEEDHKICRDTITRILTCIANAKKNLVLEALRREFQLSELLEELKGWMAEMHSALDREIEEEYSPDGQEKSDGSESSPDDELEETVRPDEADIQPTMFQDKTSIRELEATRDRRVLKRAHDDAANDEEGQEADFEQDRRAVVQRTRDSAREPWTTRGHGHGKGIVSRFAQASGNPSSAPAYLGSSQQAAAQGPGASDDLIRIPVRTAYTRRRAWTGRDTDMLIKLIGETEAYYAEIERRYSDQFEYPRGQQAYRDKARNLKVDYLLNDERLPPEFDRVSLGPKEVHKLKCAGKNPYREEKHVDAAGRPTDTVWLE